MLKLFSMEHFPLGELEKVASTSSHNDRIKYLYILCLEIQLIHYKKFLSQYFQSPSAQELQLHNSYIIFPIAAQPSNNCQSRSLARLAHPALKSPASLLFQTSPNNSIT